jgi:hypothetical protein
VLKVGLKKEKGSQGKGNRLESQVVAPPLPHLEGVNAGALGVQLRRHTPELLVSLCSLRSRLLCLLLRRRDTNVVEGKGRNVRL